ncbi:hypothetical protein JMN32_05555 [Fulvivirga sp. 29W222]|uniref:Uncharacterized protein n=1 Tax=Fulvivirga marina TaxID=2494733 RepID=A0A937FTZ9_9BACT|nr:DUF6492 family protein [Fulvivirga marina]MBL6445764.1 hypothetical protein [Fulvivirga marina]
MVFDIFIKSTGQDLLCFQELQKDIKIYSNLGGKVYVSVPKQDYELFQNVISEDFILLTDQEIIISWNYSGKYYSDNWYMQQALKLLISRYIENEYYLILDSNTLITRRFDENDFYLNGLVKYNIGNENGDDLNFEYSTAAFLGLQSYKAVGFNNVNQVFNTANVRQLLKHIESLVDEPVADNLITSCLPNHEKCPPPWTEFHLYGIFSKELSPVQHHAYSRDNQIAHFKYTGRDAILKFINDIQASKPLFIKFWKSRRLDVADIPDKEYLQLISELKSSFQ